MLELSRVTPFHSLLPPSPTLPSPQCIEAALAGCHKSVELSQGYVSRRATELLDNVNLTLGDLRIGAHGPPPKIEAVEPAIVAMLVEASKRGHFLYAWMATAG